MSKDHEELDYVEKTVNTERIKRLAWAELFDAWRVMPRFLVTMYMVLVAYVVKSFFEVKTFAKIECDAALFEKLIQLNIPIDQVQAVACRAVDVVGGPTTTHTVLVTTICSLSAAIFAFYTSSGREWAKGAKPWQFRSIDDDNKVVDEPTQHSVEENIDESK